MGLRKGKYDASIGHGYVFKRQNGRPVALVFGFVDDFKIHASTRKDCVVALNAFMDLMIRLGLICQPVKTSPPGSTAEMLRVHLRYAKISYFTHTTKQDLQMHSQRQILADPKEGPSFVPIEPRRSDWRPTVCRQCNPPTLRTNSSEKSLR